MKYVLTLVGKQLSQDHLGRAADAVGRTVETDWLEPDVAADLLFEAGDIEPSETAVPAALTGEKVDICVQPALDRRRLLLVADMDSTIINVECIDEMAAMLGLRSEIARITAEAMAGRIDFRQALRQRVAMLKGLSEQELQKVYDERVSLTPGARTLVMTMRAQGAYTVLVSGGFSFYTERVADAAGFDRHVANRLETKNGRLLGTVAEPIVDADGKRETLEQLRAKLGLRHGQILAVGDGANDVAMIRAAGLGVAFRAKPVLEAAARARIRHYDLTALLYFQGYRRSEFAG